jgi:hypothetical protein
MSPIAMSKRALLVICGGVRLARRALDNQDTMDCVGGVNVNGFL